MLCRQQAKSRKASGSKRHCSRTNSIGGRILVQEEPGSPATVNPYISYCEAGERRTETDLLLGAPNNKSFLPQVMVKLVFAR
jgi:hypothetical protein